MRPKVTHRGRVLRIVTVLVMSFSVLILGACSDRAGPGQDLAAELLRQEFGFSALAVNLAGVREEWSGEGTSTTIPWRERYDRVSLRLLGEGVRPDVIALQEVYAWKGCAPGLGDYEALFHLLSGLRSRLGTNYRIAYNAVTGFPGGLCGGLSGNAVVYNADRLMNVTTRTKDAAVRFDEERLGFHLRNSHPCTNPPAQHRSLCDLIDGPAFVPAAYKDAKGRYQLGPSLSIFEFVTQPGLRLHFYNEHRAFCDDKPTDCYPEAIEAVKNAVRDGESRFGRDRLYPPVLLGDFNISAGDMRKEVANANGAFGSFDIAYQDEKDVMGILSGKTTVFPARYPLIVLDARSVPAAVPGGRLCSSVNVLWSDHCGHFVRLSPVSGPPDPPLPRVPNVVGETADQAKRTLTSSDYQVTLSNVIDRTCENIRRVMSQSPNAGTPFARGLTVDIRIGALPRPPAVCP